MKSVPKASSQRSKFHENRLIQMLQLIEGLSVLNKHVEENEKDVLRYQMYKQVNAADGAECLVYIEV